MFKFPEIFTNVAEDPHFFQIQFNKIICKGIRFIVLVIFKITKICPMYSKPNLNKKNYIKNSVKYV